MPYIVTESCKGVKDKSCLSVCPVDCIYDSDEEDMVYIHPDQCIDCGLCEPECPVNAIFTDMDLPEEMQEYVEINKTKAEELMNKS